MENQNKDRHFLIYAHVNKINGKIYIGQSGGNPKDRWDNGRGYKKCEKMWNAIQKYRWKNFEHIIICDHLTAKEADVIEDALIEKYHTRDRDKGYNIRKGGSAHHQTAESTKEKLRQANKAQFADKGKRLRHMQACGYHYVLCIEDKKIFESAKLAADYYGFPGGTNICKACKGDTTFAYRDKSGKPLHWAYVDTDDITKIDFSKFSIPSVSTRKTGVKKAVVCIETGIEYPSLSAAAKAAHIKNGNNIALVCDGARQTAGYLNDAQHRLHWRWKESK